MTVPSVPGGQTGPQIGPQTGPAVVDRVRIQVADRLTTDLRDVAAKAGWPQKLVFRLRVVWTGSTWEVKIPQSIKSMVADLEYGTQTQPPNPVIRRFSSDMGKQAEKAAAQALVNLGAEVLA